MCHVACNRHRLHVTCCMSKVRGGDWSRSWWPINITSFHWRSSHGKNYKHIYLHNERILSHWSLAESPDQEKPARRFITRTLHDFSWRYLSSIYYKDISGHPDHYHYVSMPPAPPCSDMTLDATLPPLHNCPPSVARKSRIIWWESESQWFRVRGGHNKNVSAARPGHFQH